MKRPLATVGISFLLTLAVLCIFLPRHSTIFVVFLAIVLVFICAFKSKNAAFIKTVIVSGIVACVFFVITDHSQKRLAKKICGRASNVIIMVTDIDEYSEKFYIKADIIEVDDIRTKVTRTAFYSNELLTIGDIYKTKLELRSFDQAQFGSELFIRSTVVGGKIRRESPSILSVNAEFKQDLARNIARFLGGNEGSLVSAIITGDKGYVPIEVDIALKKSGISHVLVISGLHISLLLGMCLTFFKNTLKLDNKITFVVVSLAGIFLIGIYGASASVLRAVFMNWLVLCGQLIGRRSDPLTTMSAAAVVILVLNPKAAGEASFALSFGCCFAICFVVPKAKTWLDRSVPVKYWSNIDSHVVSSLVMSVCICITTFPILVLYGMPFSVVSPLTNVVALVFIKPILIVGLFVGLLGSIGVLTPVFSLFALFCGICAKLVIGTATFLAGFALASVSTTDSFIRWWLLCALIVACVYFIGLKKDAVKPRTSLVGLCLAIVLLIGILSKIAFTIDKEKIYIYENKAVIVQSDGETLVILFSELDFNKIQNFKYWCDIRFIECFDYAIINEHHKLDSDLLSHAVMDAKYILDNQIMLGQAEITVNKNGCSILVNGTEIEIFKVGNASGGALLAMISGSDSVAKEISKTAYNGFRTSQNSYYDSYVIYVSRDGNYKSVRE